MFYMCVKLFYFMDILSDVNVAGNLTTDGNIDTNGRVVVRSSTTGLDGVYANSFNIVSNFDSNCGNSFNPYTEIYIKGNKIQAPNATANFNEVFTCTVNTNYLCLNSIRIGDFLELKDILSIPYNIPRTTEVVVTVPENCTKFQVHTTRTTEYPIVNVWHMCYGKSVQMDLRFDSSNRKLYAEMATGFSSSTNLKFMINEV